MAMKGLAGFLNADLPTMVRECGKSPLEVILSEVRDAPEQVRREVVTAEPFSRNLFSSSATKEILASLPKIINVPTPQQPR